MGRLSSSHSFETSKTFLKIERHNNEKIHFRIFRRTGPTLFVTDDVGCLRVTTGDFVRWKNCQKEESESCANMFQELRISQHLSWHTIICSDRFRYAKRWMLATFTRNDKSNNNYTAQIRKQLRNAGHFSGKTFKNKTAAQCRSFDTLSTKCLKIHQMCQASLVLRVTSTGDSNVSDDSWCCVYQHIARRLILNWPKHLLMDGSLAT